MNREEMYERLMEMGLKIELIEGTPRLISCTNEPYVLELTEDGIFKLNGVFTVKQLRALSMWAWEEL